VEYFPANRRSIARESIVLEARGGPKVRPSARRGFGTELIQRQIKSTLDGEVRFDYRPEGIVVQITIPHEKNDVSDRRT
jgi:two-component sensor histidine kinase